MSRTVQKKTSDRKYNALPDWYANVMSFSASNVAYYPANDSVFNALSFELDDINGSNNSDVRASIAPRDLYRYPAEYFAFNFLQANIDGKVNFDYTDDSNINDNYTTSSSIAIDPIHFLANLGIPDDAVETLVADVEASKQDLDPSSLTLAAVAFNRGAAYLKLKNDEAAAEIERKLAAKRASKMNSSKKNGQELVVSGRPVLTPEERLKRDKQQARERQANRRQRIRLETQGPSKR